MMRPGVHEVGELCYAGDWAGVHGDPEALARVALRLAEQTDEPVHCELVALAERCRIDPAGAMTDWVRLRELARAGARASAP